MAAEGILRALPSCWSGTLWGDGGSVAVYRVVGATADAVPTLLGWCAPFPISTLRSKPHPNQGAFTARANGWEPARQDPAGRLPADDRPGRSPAVSPADPVAASPSILRIGDPPMGILAAQGGSPAKSMSATH